MRTPEERVLEDMLAAVEADYAKAIKDGDTLVCELDDMLAEIEYYRLSLGMTSVYSGGMRNE